MHSDWMPFGWGGMGLGMIFWLVVIGLFIWLIVALIQRTGSNAPGTRTALEILDERFAKGEIDKDEYEARRKVLKG